MHNMKLTPVACPICRTEKNYTVIYPRNFRVRDINTNVFSARRLPDKIHYQLVRCRTCGLVRSTPTVNPAELYTLYSKSRLTYDEEIENLVVSYKRALEPVLHTLPRSAKLLEVGCGNGFMVKTLSDIGYTGTYGIEPSSDAVKKAPRSVRRYIKQSILKPGIFAEESFDFIFFFQTLDHIPDPNGFLKECYRLLKKGGYILAFNHNIDSIGAKLLGENSPIIDIEHTFLYSPSSISILFKKNGFTVDSVYTPYNYVSLKHIIRLSPVPAAIKKYALLHMPNLLNIHITIKLGNLCLVGRKIC